MNYKKYIGKRVMITEGIHYGEVAILLDVVKTEWLYSIKMAHLSIENSEPFVLPVNKIILLKEEI